MASAATEVRIEALIDFAISALPLAEVGSGPERSLGFGEAFAAHRAVASLVWQHRKFPEKGWPLIRAALRSPVTRDRNGALRAMAAWPAQRWPEDAEAVLQRGEEEEPNEDVRERFQKVLAGEDPFGQSRKKPSEVDNR